MPHTLSSTFVDTPESVFPVYMYSDGYSRGGPRFIRDDNQKLTNQDAREAYQSAFSGPVRTSFEGTIDTTKLNTKARVFRSARWIVIRPWVCNSECPMAMTARTTLYSVYAICKAVLATSSEPSPAATTHPRDTVCNVRRTAATNASRTFLRRICAKVRTCLRIADRHRTHSRPKLFFSNGIPIDNVLRFRNFERIFDDLLELAIVVCG